MIMSHAKIRLAQGTFNRVLSLQAANFAEGLDKCSECSWFKRA